MTRKQKFPVTKKVTSLWFKFQSFPPKSCIYFSNFDTWILWLSAFQRKLHAPNVQHKYFSRNSMRECIKVIYAKFLKISWRKFEIFLNRQVLKVQITEKIVWRWKLFNQLITYGNWAQIVLTKLHNYIKPLGSFNLFG